MKDTWEDWFQKDERLLWQGAPAPGQWNWVRNILFMVLGLPFLGAGLFTAGMGMGHIFSLQSIWEFGLGLFLAAFSVPFILVGIAMVFGTWIQDILKPSRTRYALTNRAGYIATQFWKRNMDIIPIQPDTEVEVQEGRKETMTIFFGFDHYTDSDGDRQTRKKGFEDIMNGRAVYRLIRAIKAGEEVSPI